MAPSASPSGDITALLTVASTAALLAPLAQSLEERRAIVTRQDRTTSQEPTARCPQLLSA